MAQFGSATEYGLHCLLYLVGAPENEPASSRDLAEFQGVSPSYVAKLFTKLEKAGLVASAEGVRGGFRLARPADRITVLEVVDAIEGEKALFECREVRRRCVLYGDAPPTWATGGICAIHAVMLDAERHMREALAAHTLADLARTVADKVPARSRQATAAWFAARGGSRLRHTSERSNP